MKMDWQAISVSIAVMGLALSGLNIWVTLRIQLAFSKMETAISENRRKDEWQFKAWAEERFVAKPQFLPHSQTQGD